MSLEYIDGGRHVEAVEDLRDGFHHQKAVVDIVHGILEGGKGYSIFSAKLGRFYLQIEEGIMERGHQDEVTFDLIGMSTQNLKMVVQSRVNEHN